MDHSSLHEAIRAVVTESRTPPKAIATDIGIPYATLMSYTYEPGENDGARGLPARLIVPITKATGNTALLDFLEAAVGRLAFAIPKADGPPAEILKIAGAVAREAGQAISALGESVEDGMLNELERLSVVREIREAIRELARALAAVGERP